MIVRWTFTFMLLIALVVLVGGYVYSEATAGEPWDGEFRCNPGSNYTTKECP